MIKPAELLSWLSAVNQRYSTEGIPHKARPFEALSDFTREHNCSIAMGDPLERSIFDWFYHNSPPRAHQMGAVYTGVYLYDTAYWQTHIPFVFGQVKVDAFECLETMPVQIKKHLVSNEQDVYMYIDHWLNCLDYGYGKVDLTKGIQLQPRALRFFGAANSELVGANAQLLETRPNSKAILGMRMATEIFLKTVLIQERSLTDKELMKISHKLENAARACADATGENAFEEIEKRVNVYPPVSARYDDTEWLNAKVWEAAALTQLTAATVTRLYTDQNARLSLVRTDRSNA